MADKQTVLALVDLITAHDEMGPLQAIEWIEDLMADLEARVDGLKTDLEKVADE